MSGSECSTQNLALLRRRLGWSRAELGMRLGCSASLVESWELGHSQPDPEMLNQLRHLAALVEVENDKLQQKPMADSLMAQKNWSQLTHADLLAQPEWVEIT